MNIEYLATVPSTIEVIQQREEEKVIKDAITKLTERQKQCIEYFINSSKQKDAANELGISSEAVSQAKERAFRKLYVILSQHFPERIVHGAIKKLGLGHLYPIITSKCH